MLIRAAGLCLAVAVLAAAGCGRDGPSQATVEAVRLLQQNEPQKAVDVLASDSSARAHYLRAVAFERQKRAEQASEQMAVALEAEPENVDYRGYDLRLQLRQGNGGAADELIALREANRTSAALALFAFYAYAGKAKGLNQRGDKDAAHASSREAMKSLETSIALSAHIPEFQRELLELSLAAGLREGADILTEKLRKAAPSDPGLARERVYALLQVNKPDEAVETARTLFQDLQPGEETAALYSLTLQRARVTPAHDQAFRKLAEAYPGNVDIVTNHAIYLTRAQKRRQASAVLAQALERQTAPAPRRRLIDAAIGLPLETGDVDAAEQALDQYREEIADPVVFAYYEGRMAFLRGDHRQALEKMAFVLNSQEEASTLSRRLGAEALRWSQVILNDLKTRETFGQAAEAVSAPEKSKVESAEAEKPEDRTEEPGRRNGQSEQ